MTSPKARETIRSARAAGFKTFAVGVADERALVDGYYFDPEKALRWSEFFEFVLTHTRGDLAGKPFKLLPWQRDQVIAPLFGWIRPCGNQRRFTKGDIFVAKKQGKSTIAGGLACAFLARGGQRSEVYGVAHTRDQAGIIYREAAAMVRGSETLASRMKPRDSQKRILYPETQSFYQALAGEASSRGIEGINPNLILFDEIHVQRSRELYDALTYASAARENSLMLSVSTVGVADETTIWWEQYKYAQGILDGTIRDHQRFAYIAQADEICKTDAKARMDSAQWRKAMPSLGETVTPDKVREAVVEAENAPAKMNNLLRYMFNIPTASVVRLIDVSEWNQLAADVPNLAGRECYGGLDVASSEDLTTFVLYFPATDNESAYVVPYFWCPEEKIRQRVKRGMHHYQNWVNDGWLIETPGNRIEHEQIEMKIRELSAEFDIVEIPFDKWNADAIINPLQVDGFPVVQVEQTFAGISTGCNALLDSIADGELKHDGNPVMAWCCGNVAGETKYGDALRFSKDKSKDKIDGAVALAMAMGRAVSGVGAASGSLFVS